MFTKKQVGLIAVAVASMAAAGLAFAGTDTVDLTVQASVDKACVVGTPTTMNFGSLALLNASAGKVVTTGNADATGKFYTACTNGSTGVTYTFVGGESALFKMNDGGSNKITYTLFSDSSRSTGITRATAAASSAFSGFAADGADHELSVYGRVDLASNVAKPVGSYADTVTITVTYD